MGSFLLCIAAIATAQVSQPARSDCVTPVVVVAVDAGEAERLAGAELSRYLGRICGTAIEIIAADGSAELPARAVVVCRQGRALHATVKPAVPSLPPESYVVNGQEGRSYLVGADDRAVLYAVYDFLSRLGCRWLAPGLDFYDGANEHVPVLATVLPAPAPVVVNSPVLKFRKLYVEEGHTHDEGGLRRMIEWMPKLRWNTLVVPIDYQGHGRVKWDNWREALTPELKSRGIIIEVGGHGYQNFLNAEMQSGRLYAEHPEWFGQDEEGRRSPQPGRVFCTSNAEAVKFLQESVLAYLEKRPEIEIFDFWPPDGARWCTCESCKAMGTPSDRHAMLVSAMAAYLKARLPRVRVECIAYSNYLRPPEGATIDAGILIDFCPIGQSFETQIDEPGSPMNQMYRSALAAWRSSFKGDISVYSYYRKYAWNSLPVIIPHYMQRDLRYYHRAGAAGVSTYAEPGDWATYELNHYVLAHLAWHPDADVKALSQEFCQARYGPAQGKAAEVFTIFEDTVRHACSLPGTAIKTPADYDERLLPAIRRCRSLIEEGKTGLSQGPHTQALDRLATCVEYASRDMAIQRQRAADGPREDRRRMVDELAAFIREHAGEGVLVDRRINRPGLYVRYGIETRPRGGPRRGRPASRPGPQ